MANLSKLLTTWREKFDRLGGFLKKALLAIVFSLFLFFVLYFFLVGRVKYVVLFSRLELAHSANIVEEIERIGNIKYKLDEGGQTILVDEKAVTALRLKLAMTGNLLDTTTGYELFDNQGLMVTDQDRKIMYQRATQGELERTIRSLKEVLYARVHLNMSESTLFDSEPQSASATIVLELEPSKTLTASQVEGIISLVSGAVKNLPKENVMVLDTKANLLSAFYKDPKLQGGGTDGSDSQDEIVNRIERKVAGNLTELLETALGRDKVVVTVLAEVNFDGEEIFKVIYGNAPVVKNRQESFSGGGIKAAISAGPLDNNTQNLILQDENGGVETYEAYTEYEIDKTEVSTVKAVGVISKLNISVVYDGTLSSEMKDRIQNMVVASAGINLTRGDQINIEGLAFDRTYEETLLADMNEAKLQESLAGKWLGVDKRAVYGVLSAIMLIILAAAALRFFGKSRKKHILPQSETTNLQGGTSLKTGAVQMGLLNLTDADAEEKASTMDALFGKVKKQDTSLKKYAKDNPQEIAELLQSWIKE